MKNDDVLRVTEVFDSIEGEGKRAGELATFIRLTGCNLRCSYCDTTYAFDGGQLITVGDILQKVHYRNVTITGGEPLAQPLAPLLQQLKSYNVNIETNGSIPITPYLDFPHVFFTIDFKCGSSGMRDTMILRNFSKLRKRDVLKFVVGDMNDLREAEAFFFSRERELRKCKIYVSPVFGKISPEDIVEFMKQEKLAAWKLQLQIHKIIWDPQKRGV